jgi:hypothetical protein
MGKCRTCKKTYEGHHCKTCRNEKARKRYKRKLPGGDEHVHEDEPSVFPRLSTNTFPRFAALADFVASLGTCDESTFDHRAEVDLETFAPVSLSPKERSKKVAELLRETTGIRWQ